ncbi:MAG: hypothetical protein AAF357_14050, partial [Verrucomicrobiota bacterium]
MSKYPPRLLNPTLAIFLTWITISVMIDGPALADTPLQLGPRRDVTIAARENAVFELTVSGSTPHFWSQPVTVPPD